MFELWRTGTNKNNLIEKVATFERKIYAMLFCDYMTEKGGDYYVIKEIKERTKELSLEGKFNAKLKDLEKDFNLGMEKAHDFDFER